MRSIVITVALIGCSVLAPETAARVSWFGVKLTSLENLAPEVLHFEVLKMVLWCAVPSLVGAAVGALCTAIIIRGLLGDAHTERLRSRPEAEHLAMLAMSLALATVAVWVASTALAFNSW